MRVTDNIEAPWTPWADRSAATARERTPGAAHQARTATIANELDADPRDGWIDEDTLPYDQVELLQRARAAKARAAAREQPAAEAPPRAEAPAPPPAVGATAHIDVTAPDGPLAAPQVDLLA